MLLTMIVTTIFLVHKSVGKLKKIEDWAAELSQLNESLKRENLELEQEILHLKFAAGRETGRETG